jgi:hypothetical protein
MVRKKRLKIKMENGILTKLAFIPNYSKKPQTKSHNILYSLCQLLPLALPPDVVIYPHYAGYTCLDDAQTQKEPKTQQKQISTGGLMTLSLKE